MSEQHAAQAPTRREQELELEVARLAAEIEALSGHDPGTATSRFLAMAAATVDQAVADARREADELAEEISAAAEARRDEATRVAAEAELTAERLLSEAENSQQIITEAETEAASIRAMAVEEADELVTFERARMADERTTLTDVREALQIEREELEAYRAGLRNRVENLAQAMLAIMTTDLGPESRTAVEDLLVPALKPVVDHEPERPAAVEPPSAETVGEFGVDEVAETVGEFGADEVAATVGEFGADEVAATVGEFGADEVDDGWWGGVIVMDETDVTAEEPETLGSDAADDVADDAVDDQSDDVADDAVDDQSDDVADDAV
ncbi:MAG: ATP synthase F0 subunit B, partial [Actinobacteria bacterium]|nr:ATP synthase F0 subunit B [Actinomycetota bacterium]NIS35946.1 ATP synthase F0 subunit B [Actinomycetota bacterium]NIT98445.1 ATP synthase F0 subunit B [Actinomycetota bacterium]NIU22054.1 ATP synthase F0 subunit B [Actinomycetota bacterium]NIU70543.1 ATP synthase F0 subunit B [Actinomycetota bacterium]